MKVSFGILITVFCAIQQTRSYRFWQDARRINKPKCEKVRTEICTKYVHERYNSTAFPNLRNHKTQDEALYEFGHYIPLISVGCSKHLATFLCSLYLPLCTPGINTPINLMPCRYLCNHSMQGCAPLMQKFGFKWRFNCNNFPDGKKEMCVGNEFEKEATKEHKTNKTRKSKKIKERHHKKGWITGKEDSTINLKCPFGKAIHIRKIRHTKSSSCCPLATKAVLTAMCSGHKQCRINVATDLGGHCKKNIGKLAVRYKCVYALKEKPCIEQQ